MHGISRADMQAMLLQLEQAIQNHQQWYESIVRILICRLPFEPNDASPEAHRRCQFGKWYYSSAPDRLRGHPGFVAVEAEHELMHRMAARLLQEMEAGGSVRSEDYDAFAGALAQLRLQLETLRRELEHALGDLDPLTGAYNRSSMLTWLREQQALVRRGVLSCSLAMIDLDRFKAVNDSFGHLAGDQTLTDTSHYLIDHIRSYDKLYRYGGEEFLLCTLDTDLATCFALVDRLREALALNPVAYEGQVIPRQVSCGIAPLEPGLPVERSIERADRALYAAKSGGRNRTRLWDSSLG